MGLDITLVDRLGCELSFNDHVGFLEPLFQVAKFVLDMTGDVAFGAGVVADGETVDLEVGRQVLVEQWRVFFHRFIEGKDRIQDFVVDLDQFQGLLRYVGAGGRYGSHGMSQIEGLAGGHDMLGHEAGVSLGLGQVDHRVVDDGEIFGRNHRRDAGQRLRLAGVDGLYPGVGVGTAQHLAVKHAGKLYIGPILGRPDDFIHAVVANGPSAYDVILTGFRRLLVIGGCSHVRSPKLDLLIAIG